MNVSTHQPCTISVLRPFDQLQILRRVRGEFREMPGMRLTLEQAMRLWSLNRETCASVLDELMASRFIERDVNGRYKRAHGSY
jgi:hypothetical protein